MLKIRQVFCASGPTIAYNIFPLYHFFASAIYIVFLFFVLFCFFLCFIGKPFVTWNSILGMHRQTTPQFQLCLHIQWASWTHVDGNDAVPARATWTNSQNGVLISIWCDIHSIFIRRIELNFLLFRNEEWNANRLFNYVIHHTHNLYSDYTLKTRSSCIQNILCFRVINKIDWINHYRCL